MLLRKKNPTMLKRSIIAHARESPRRGTRSSMISDWSRRMHSQIYKRNKTPYFLSLIHHLSVNTMLPYLRRAVSKYPDEKKYIIKRDTQSGSRRFHNRT